MSKVIWSGLWTNPVNERSPAQILAQKKLKGEVRDLLDIIDLCIAYKAPELENYAPTMHWHVREITEGQTKILTRHRVDLSCRSGSRARLGDHRHDCSLSSKPAGDSQTARVSATTWATAGDSAALSKPAASRLIAELKTKLEAAAAW